MDKSGLWPFAFVLAVQEVGMTAAHSQDALGFDLRWADTSDWRPLSRGKVNVMIANYPGAIPAGDLGDHSYFG